MVTNQDLADASIALSRILTKRKVKFGLFGEYAVTLLGGQRSCTKLDCRIATTKDNLLRLIDGKGGFRASKPLCRPNGSGAIGILWNSKHDKARASTVWVLFRCDDYPSGKTTLAGVSFIQHAVTGRYEGKGTTWVLDPFAVFCSKLLAAAVRENFTDAFDLRCLVKHHGEAIKTKAGRLDPSIVGLVILRHEILERTFAGLGMNIDAAKELVQNKELGGADDMALMKVRLQAFGVAKEVLWDDFGQKAKL